MIILHILAGIVSSEKKAKPTTSVPGKSAIEVPRYRVQRKTVGAAANPTEGRLRSGKPVWADLPVTPAERVIRKSRIEPIAMPARRSTRETQSKPGKVGKLFQLASLIKTILRNRACGLKALTGFIKLNYY